MAVRGSETPDAPRPTSPGIVVPPPLVFVAGYGVAWWLHTRLPFEIDGAGPGAVQIALGLAAAISGVALMVWGFLTFIRARTAIWPGHPARQIVQTGPYRFTRNPMYVGLTLMYFGLALLSNLAWPLVVLPVVLLTMNGAIIAAEERYLTAAFGSAYTDYCAKVRRWI